MFIRFRISWSEIKVALFSCLLDSIASGILLIAIKKAPQNRLFNLKRSRIRKRGMKKINCKVKEGSKIFFPNEKIIVGRRNQLDTSFFLLFGYGGSQTLS